MTWHLTGHLGYDTVFRNDVRGHFHYSAETGPEVKEAVCRYLSGIYTPPVRDAVKNVEFEAFKDGDVGPVSLHKIGERYDVKVTLQIELKPKKPKERKANDGEREGS